MIYYNTIVNTFNINEHSKTKKNLFDIKKSYAESVKFNHGETHFLQNDIML